MDTFLRSYIEEEAYAAAATFSSPVPQLDALGNALLNPNCRPLQTSPADPEYSITQSECESSRLCNWAQCSDYFESYCDSSPSYFHYQSMTSLQSLMNYNLANCLDSQHLGGDSVCAIFSPSGQITQVLTINPTCEMLSLYQYDEAECEGPLF
jgi:hypothetical protein